jgi:hypothetical protein
MCHLPRILACACALGVLGSCLPAAEITVEKSKAGAVVQVDGQLFTEYVTRSGTKPILWPIIGPTGKPMTRAYPMADAEGEKKDHVHHRSLWFTHGSVNGNSFWMESKDKPATIEHREFVKLSSGPPATITVRNDWMAGDGKRVCEEEQVLRFGADADARWIDLDLTIKATGGPVVFGDTKEGAFGVRVAETISVDAKKGGRIVNSEGQTDKDAWAKRAAWVDYHGPVAGETVGVAIFDHPASFRHPTYWHVRTYGLFAANPFGVRDFTGDKTKDGSHTIAAGETMKLRYRVFLHRGDEKAGKVAEAYQRYCREVK